VTGPALQRRRLRQAKLDRFAGEVEAGVETRIETLQQRRQAVLRRGREAADEWPLHPAAGPQQGARPFVGRARRRALDIEGQRNPAAGVQRRGGIDAAQISVEGEPHALRDAVGCGDIGELQRALGREAGGPGVERRFAAGDAGREAGQIERARHIADRSAPAPVRAFEIGERRGRGVARLDADRGAAGRQPVDRDGRRAAAGSAERKPGRRPAFAIAADRDLGPGDLDGVHAPRPQAADRVVEVDPVRGEIGRARRPDPRLRDARASEADGLDVERRLYPALGQGPVQRRLNQGCAEHPGQRRGRQGQGRNRAKGDQASA